MINLAIANQYDNLVLKRADKFSQDHGVILKDIEKLQAAGLYTVGKQTYMRTATRQIHSSTDHTQICRFIHTHAQVESVAYSTLKSLTAIKGITDVKATKLIDAGHKLLSLPQLLLCSSPVFPCCISLYPLLPSSSMRVKSTPLPLSPSLLFL
jgi:hypothetical protein